MIQAKNMLKKDDIKTSKHIEPNFIRTKSGDIEIMILIQNILLHSPQGVISNVPIKLHAFTDTSLNHLVQNNLLA